VPDKNLPPLPAHWSPRQALAVFECLEHLRDQLWVQYASKIQRAYRDDLQPQRPNPRQLPLPFDDNHESF
jgi:hypothetical protein